MSASFVGRDIGWPPELRAADGSRLHPLYECLQVAGSRGCGKSTLVKALWRQRMVRRRLVLDPLGDYDAETQFTARNAEELRDYCESLTAGPAPATEEFSVRFMPDDGMPEAQAAALLCEWGFYLQDCNVTLEEANDAARHGAVDPVVIRMAKRGRHYNVGLWCVSQRPSDVATSLRAELQAAEAFYLRLVEANDLDVLRERRGREFADTVANLPKFEGRLLVPGEREPIVFLVADNPPAVWTPGQGAA